MGYRYSCGHSECKKTYLSWSPALISALPQSVQLQFPFHLTHRSGLSDQVVSMLRGDFLHGIGPVPFANTIRVNHIRRFEKLHLQYLEMIYERAQSGAAQFLPKFEPFGEFGDRDGYAGFVPSPQYFRNFYVRFILSHAQEMDQYTTMLSARLLQIDHSFKVPKHIARLNGVPVYEALHTSINEYSEIRSMTLTPTKAHNQFMPALAAVSASLKTYGHDPVEGVMTDNPRGDKAALEAVLPSLRKDIVPVPDPKAGATLSLPNDMTINMLLTEFQVKTRLESIMSTASGHKDVHAAVDMEWPVNTTTGIQGHIAVISVTFGDEIFLIPLGSYIHQGYLHLPHSLLTFLRTPCMRKVGVNIKSDLTRLFNNCGFKQGVDPPFVGALELAQLAKEKNAAPRANVGLADLCSAVLRKYLPKDPSIRISEEWSAVPLSDAHANYAALDVYATWKIFRALQVKSHGITVNQTTPGGTPVYLYSSDGSQPVAWGHIALDRPKEFRGVNVTKTRVLVLIKSVMVPGHIVTADLLSTHRDTALSDLPTAPYILLCKAKHVRTRSEPDSELSSSPLEPTSSPLPQPSPITAMPKAEPAPHSASSSGTSDVNPAPETANWCSITSYETPAESLTNYSRDPKGEKMAANLLQMVISMVSDVLRSRVLGDIWHLMDQFPISQHHALRAPFARALRDAIFLFDPEDKAIMEDFLQKQNISWESILRCHPDWVLRRVKRIVPCPEELLPRVAKVLHSYGPLQDPKTGQPLFNQQAWDICTNVLENIRRGYYSDPPGIPFYYLRGKDKNGLMRYRCVRGTNGIEGGVHQNVIRWFAAFNASPEFAVELLRDYRQYHNLRVGTLNRTGSPYRGSYDIWTQNRISDLLDRLTTSFATRPSTFGPGGWVNGNNYQPSTEIFGVLPISKEQKARLGMHDFNAEYAKATKTRYQKLAIQQNTLVAVVPVHTKAERELFRAMIAVSGKEGDGDGLFTGKAQPNWETVAARWNEHAEGHEIFYKVPEHLKSHWKNWEDWTNEKNAIKINQAMYDEVARLLKPPAGSVPSVPVANAQPLSRQIASGRRPNPAPAAEPIERWQILHLLGRHSSQQFAVQYTYLVPQPTISKPQGKGKKRTHDEVQQGEKEVQTRQTRRCPRPNCRKTNCKGKYNSRPCEPED
ncbi:hypothetical protein AX17_004351 [Amanita inopinata Kibby_2008]|nr:hypothetical protein AX17_004351 [Amanita inopinata Kibby_2008]